MDLDIGCGLVKRAEITVDLNREVRPTVVADARLLPFRDKTFNRVYAFNILEHIKDYDIAIGELQRVCKKFVLIRFDKIYNLANWWTFGHEYIQYGRHLIPAPRVVKFLRYLLWFPFLRSGGNASRMITKSLPVSESIDGSVSGNLIKIFASALIRIHLLDSWNYYIIICNRD